MLQFMFILIWSMCPSTIVVTPQNYFVTKGVTMLQLGLFSPLEKK